MRNFDPSLKCRSGQELINKTLDNDGIVKYCCEIKDLATVQTSTGESFFKINFIFFKQIQ